VCRLSIGADGCRYVSRQWLKRCVSGNTVERMQPRERVIKRIRTCLQGQGVPVVRVPRAVRCRYAAAAVAVRTEVVLSRDGGSKGIVVELRLRLMCEILWYGRGMIRHTRGILPRRRRGSIDAIRITIPRNDQRGSTRGLRSVRTRV
jgi:hypothetical protein